MKPNIALISAAGLVAGVSGLAFAQADKQMTIHAPGETYGIGVGFTMLILLGTLACLAYIAGRIDGGSA